jgi:hypothetical protein
MKGSRRMKYRHLLTTTIALSLSVSAGCGDNQQPQEARTLWDRIQAEDYRSFERAPGYPNRQATSAPHSDQVDIYINSVMADAISGGTVAGSWPEGSLVVKDGFTDDGELEIVAVMDKRQDGWFYAEYFDFDGEAKFSGQPDVCVSCHSSGADFIRAFGFP